ncbi:hypothetical protein FQA39_LY10535 [Lamprigera yunnana]|nr:hypothetical protein FQA39_LY10535 [Lamprigera yunnana]
MIENRRKLKNFNKCNMTYWFNANRRYKKYSTEVAYVTRFVLDIMDEVLNLTIVPLHSGAINKGLYMYVSRLETCTDMTHCTDPFLRNAYIWTVPPPRRINPMVVFKIVYKPFVWILILLTFLSTSIIWWFISYCTRTTNFASALLNVYSLTLFGFISKIPTGLSLRVIFIAYVIYAIHIQSIFVSNLVKMLTIPQYEHGINNLEELVESDLPILIDKYDMQLFKAKMPNNSLYTKVTNKFRLVSYYEGLVAIRNQTTLEHNSVFVIFDVLYESVQEYKTKLNTIVDNELIGMEQRTYGTKYGSPYLLILNNIVNMLLESGLINLKQMEFKSHIKEENLLNTFDPNYKNRDLRNAFLQHIAKEMKLEKVADVTKKIKNLRSTYNQEIIKIAKSKQRGSGTDDEYKPSIKWFDLMDYIMKIIKLKEKITSNLEIPKHDGNVEDDVTDTSKPKKPIVKKLLHKINVLNEQNSIKDAIDELKQLNNSLAEPAFLEQEDECDLIGKHTAYQLRQLPLLDMMDARDQIQQILSAYRKKYLYAYTVGNNLCSPSDSTTTPLCSPSDTSFSPLRDGPTVSGQSWDLALSSPTTSAQLAQDKLEGYTRSAPRVDCEEEESDHAYKERTYAEWLFRKIDSSEL